MIDRSTVVFTLNRRMHFYALLTAVAPMVVLFTLAFALWLVSLISLCGGWLLGMFVYILPIALPVLFLVGGVGGTMAVESQRHKISDERYRALKAASYICLLVVFMSLICLCPSGRLIALWRNGEQYADSLMRLGAGFSTVTGLLAKRVFDFTIGFDFLLWVWGLFLLAVGMALGTLLLLGLMRLEPVFKRVFHRVRYKCPACGQERPAFRCPNPNCQELHPDLAPSSYGLFFARCGRCAHALPTLDLLGRLQLDKVCGNPLCNHDLKGEQFGVGGEYHIAVVGAQSSGKTNYLIATLMRLVQDFAPNNGYTATIPDVSQQNRLKSLFEGFSRGEPAEKTASRERSMAYTVSLVSATGQKRLLYFYDVAGEDVEAGDVAAGTHGLRGQDYHGYLDGIILIIDPFAEEEFQQRAVGKKDNAARYDTAYLLSRLVPFWEEVLQVGVQRRIPVPIAVVVTKSDAARVKVKQRTGNLDEVLEAPDLSGAIPSLPGAASAAEQDSAFMKRFLTRAGGEAAVRILENRFSQVCYFGASALGRRPQEGDTSAFQPRRVLGPLVWLCHRGRVLTDGASPRRESLANALEYFGRCFAGYEGGMTQLISWCSLFSLIAGLTYLCWRLAGPYGAIGAVLAWLLLVGLWRWKLEQMEAGLWKFLGALARGRLWFWRGLMGELGPSMDRLTGSLLTVTTVGLIVLLIFWWQGGVGVIGFLLGMIGLSCVDDTVE